METLIIIVLAVVLDLTLGDPPNPVHPVAWMGKVINFLEKGNRLKSHAGQFIYGAFITVFTVALFTIPLYYIFLYLGHLSLIASTVLAAVLLKCTFSIRGLRLAALKVRDVLMENKCEDAPFELRALVSRETSGLSTSLMTSAAVESVAEGTCDSLVAPLFYFLLFGVPGAIAFRVINTLDSMIGYHGKYEYLGKFAARLDDILCFIPARLASIMLVLAAFVIKENGANAWRTALREHVKTESPNAGWPMAAMAGALDVRLEKQGHYRLGKGGLSLSPAFIDSSVRLFSAAAYAWISLCLFGGVIEFVVTTQA